MLRLDVNSIHPKKDLHYVIDQFTQQLQGRITLAKDIPVLRKDKTVVFCDVNSTAVKINNQDMLLGFFRDMTENRKAEEMIRKEKETAQKYLDIAGVMIIAIGIDGKVKLINRKGCKVLGYKEKEVIGKDWFSNFLPKRLRKEVKKVSKKMIAGKVKPVEYHENPVLTKSGEERVIAWHYTLIHDDEGNITGHLSSGEDITGKKKTEQALLESEERWRSLAQNAPNIIMITDKEGKIQFINRTKKGYTEENVVGTSIYRYIEPRHHRMVKSVVRQVLKTGKGGLYEIEGAGKKGQKSQYRTNVGPIKHKGKIVAISHIISDITEYKKKEYRKEIKSLKNKLKARKK